MQMYMPTCIYTRTEMLSAHTNMKKEKKEKKTLTHSTQTRTHQCMHICMDANVHAYMHVCTDIDALCTYKYEKKTGEKKSQSHSTQTRTHQCMHVHVFV